MNLPDFRHPFAKTNIQTIRQRAGLLRELAPGKLSIGEICCGDCQAQYDLYRAELGISRFRGLDLSPEVVALNRSRGIPCDYGNALDGAVMRKYLDYEVIFFGPPLSVECDGHRLIAFRDVTPGFLPFVELLLRDLQYQGLLVLIGPRTTTPGDAQWVEHHARQARPDYRLRLLHYSHASITGLGEETEPRLKYVELWFQIGQEPRWEVRESV
jgi:hypothetical protein